MSFRIPGFGLIVFWIWNHWYILWNHYYIIRTIFSALFQAKRLLGKILKFNRAWICLHFFPIFKMEFVTQQRKKETSCFIGMEFFEHYQKLFLSYLSLKKILMMYKKSLKCKAVWFYMNGPSKVDAWISSKQFSGLKLCFLCSSVVYLLKFNWFKQKKVHFVYSKLILRPKTVC